MGFVKIVVQSQRLAGIPEVNMDFYSVSGLGVFRAENLMQNEIFSSQSLLASLLGVGGSNGGSCDLLLVTQRHR